MSTAHLRSIELDELVERAALLNRIDRKYVIPRAALPDLLAAVPADTQALTIAGQRTFGYRSVYLDTPDLVTFKLAGQKRRRRFKVRTRSYLDTGTSWLEVKTRGRRGLTEKQRISHPDAEIGGLNSEGREFVNMALTSAGIGPVDPAELRPTMVTSYERTTLFLPTTASRTTIDTELGWTSLGETTGDLDRPGIAIVETKTGATPSAVDRLLWRRGHRPVSISKYGVGMAALHGERPLKWHRVLTRDLGVLAA